MKTIKIIISFIMGFHLFSIAQSYVPMPTTKAVWTISQVSFGLPGTLKFGMYGDTLINNVSYKKIYRSYDYNFDIANSAYRGAIREYAKKVYKVYPGTFIEGILYDFTLAIGDTAKCMISPGTYDYRKVTTIDSIIYNGQVHKKWAFESTGLFWMEGIGSSGGLFYAFNGPDNCASLVCLSINDTVRYQANPTCFNATAPYNCDGGFVSVNELSIENIKSIIFPNPFSSSAIIKTNIELDNATLKVFDILGQAVLINTHLRGQEIKIIKGNLNNGNYYYHVIQNGNLISKGKFIVE
jgi:hypothetical protein